MKKITVPTLARFLTPVAMVIFLTMEITKSQEDKATSYWIYVIPVAAFATSLGIELWGITAGKNLQRAWQVSHSKWATAIQLGLYVAVTMFLLYHNLTLIALPIVAALVYVSVAMSESLDTAVNQQERVEAIELDYGLDKRQKDDEHRRKMEEREAEQRAANELQLALASQQTQTQIEIEKQRASVEKKRIASEKTAVTNGHIQDTSKTDWRLLSDTERLRMLDFTPDEIAKRFNVSSKTAGRWLNRAREMSGHMSANGHVK